MLIVTCHIVPLEPLFMYSINIPKLHVVIGSTSCWGLYLVVFLYTYHILFEHPNIHPDSWLAPDWRLQPSSADSFWKYLLHAADRSEHVLVSGAIGAAATDLASCQDPPGYKHV